MKKTALSLHIGIESLAPEYPGGYRDLIGPEKDARAMQHIAEYYGFKPTCLIGREAKRETIFKKISEAREDLKEGGTFLITFSGHGSFIEDDTDTEPSGQDARLCAYNAPITDDELYGYFVCFDAGVDIIVISDSCNTGTVLDVISADIKAVAGESATQAYRDYIRQHGPVVPPCNTKPLAANLLLISASQDYDPDGKYNAAYHASAEGECSRFTAALLKVWDNGSFGGTYYEMFEAIRCIVSDPDHQPGPMYPNFYCSEGTFSYWTSRRPFDLDESRSVAPERSKEMSNVSLLKVSVGLTDGNKADGAVIVMLDYKKQICFIDFVKRDGYCIFRLVSGTYALLCMMNYTKGGEIVQTYQTQTVIIDADPSEEILQMPIPDKKGDIKAVVKVGGLGRAYVPVTLQPGGVVQITLPPDGSTSFNYLYNGPYDLLASHPDDSAVPPQTYANIDVPKNGTVLREFTF